MISKVRSFLFGFYDRSKKFPSKGLQPETRGTQKTPWAHCEIFSAALGFKGYPITIVHRGSQAKRQINKHHRSIGSHTFFGPCVNTGKFINGGTPKWMIFGGPPSFGDLCVWVSLKTRHLYVPQKIAEFLAASDVRRQALSPRGGRFCPWARAA